MRCSALLISFQRHIEKGKVHIDFKRNIVKSGTIVIMRVGERAHPRRRALQCFRGKGMCEELLEKNS